MATRLTILGASGSVGRAVADVVEAGAVGLFVGEVDDRTFGAGQLDDALRQGVHGNLLVAADVKNLADGGGGGDQFRQGRDDIAHVAEAARLFAVAVDLQRLVLQRGRHEAGEDHAVHAHLPRADGVEEADDDDGQAVLAVVGQAQKFVDALGIGVAPARVSRGTHDHVIVFAERHPRPFAVNLGA